MDTWKYTTGFMRTKRQEIEEKKKNLLRNVERQIRSKPTLKNYEQKLQTASSDINTLLKPLTNYISSDQLVTLKVKLLSLLKQFLNSKSNQDQDSKYKEWFAQVAMRIQFQKNLVISKSNQIYKVIPYKIVRIPEIQLIYNLLNLANLFTKRYKFYLYEPTNYEGQKLEKRQEYKQNSIGLYVKKVVRIMQDEQSNKQQNRYCICINNQFDIQSDNTSKKVRKFVFFDKESWQLFSNHLSSEGYKAINIQNKYINYSFQSYVFMILYLTQFKQDQIIKLDGHIMQQSFNNYQLIKDKIISYLSANQIMRTYAQFLSTLCQ